MKIAYGVSSVGLGHARRSLTLANYLRKAKSSIEITWLTAEPVISFLESEGEKISPVCKRLESMSSGMENGVVAGKLDDMASVARRSSSIARRNYALLKPDLGNFDGLIQDEFAETMLCFLWDRHPVIPRRRVIITDYLEIFSLSRLNPASRITTWYANRMLSRAYASASLRILADEIDSVPKALRSRLLRDFSIVGPILQAPPSEPKSELKQEIVEDLFHDRTSQSNLIVVAVGGTSTGRSLVDVFAKNPEMARKLDARIVVLCGPRIDPSQFHRANDLTYYLPFTHNAMKYFKAADCVVCQAGASTLNEVLSVGSPCVAVPVSHHFEQEANARRFAEKYGFITLDYPRLNPENLMGAIHSAVSGKIHAPVDFSSDLVKAGKLVLETLEA
jgi:predicted glycosyltransferase